MQSRPARAQHDEASSSDIANSETRKQLQLQTTIIEKSKNTFYYDCNIDHCSNNLYMMSSQKTAIRTDKAPAPFPV